MNDKEAIRKEENTGSKEYPGVAVNQADDNKVNRELEKERTKVENNNPRNTDMD